MLIYNPLAGKIRRNPDTLQRTTAALQGVSVSPRLIPTEAAGHATELAREAVKQGADLVLVLGGDGTINEAANGLVHSQVALGVLPAGTANVLCMELGLGSRLERAAARLAAYEPRRISVGRLTIDGGEPRHFLCMAGAGLDARIVRGVSPAWKNRTGKLAYWLAGLTEFWHRVEPLEVRVHGNVYHCGFALASRVRNYGGDLEIASGASLRRDDFEIVLFEGSNPFRFAWYMLGVTGRRVQAMKGVTTLHAFCVDIVSGAHVQVDGEYAGHPPARLEIVPGALTLLMPPNYG